MYLGALIKMEIESAIFIFAIIFKCLWKTNHTEKKLSKIWYIKV